MDQHNGHNGSGAGNEAERSSAFTVMSSAQERIRAGMGKAAEVMPDAMAGAQERIRAGMGKAAEVMPDATARAQGATRDAQRRIDEMSDEKLLAGSSFLLGLAIGMFISGANRLLVFLVALPAASMLSTMANRRKATDTASESAGGRRSRRATAN
jgi:hypothetical protein